MARLSFTPPPLVAPFQDFLLQLVASGAKVWIVGGWVRDSLRGVTANDADFCTDASAPQIEQAAKACNIAVLLDRVAAVHGTYKLAAAGQTLDLARLRRDVARVGARHAEVTFTSSLHEDLARRDLTLNALALPYPLVEDAGLHQVIDDHGGLSDLRDHVLRLIGAPSQRLEEDPLRLLRIARFCCLPGPWQVADATKAALVRAAPLVARVSTERRLAELMRALTQAHPERFWHILEDCVAWPALLPASLTRAQRAQATAYLEAAGQRLESPLLRHAAFLLGAVTGPWRGVQLPAAADRRARTLALLAPLRFPSAWQRQLAALIEHWIVETPPSEPRQQARWALALGPRHLALLQQLAQALSDAGVDGAKPTLQTLRCVQVLVADRAVWSVTDLCLDTHAFFSSLPSVRGPQRRQLLEALLLHVWLHPQDNDSQTLGQLAVDFSSNRWPPV